MVGRGGDILELLAEEGPSRHHPIATFQLWILIAVPLRQEKPAANAVQHWQALAWPAAIARAQHQCFLFIRRFLAKHFQLSFTVRSQQRERIR